MSKSWDTGIVKKLKTLMGRGLSTAEIGKKLGLSKNAVVGKLHRMGWNPKAVEEDKKVESTKVAAKKADVKKTESKKASEKKVISVKKVAGAVKSEKKKPMVKAKPKKVTSVKTSKTEKKSTPVSKPVTKGEQRPVLKTEPKPAVVGRPIAGRGGTAHQRIVQHALEMAELKANQCRWPIGDPDSEGFHFCGKPVFVGKPYCYEHCKMAYQFTPLKKK